MSRANRDEAPAPLPLSRRNLTPVLSGLGSLALLVMGGQTFALMARSDAPRPEVVAEAPTAAGATMAQAPGIMGPPAPPGTNTAPTPAPESGQPAPVAASPTVTSLAGFHTLSRGRNRHSLPGPIGPVGPVSGPLNTRLASAGRIPGPVWDRSPLPEVGPIAIVPRARQVSRPAAPAASAPEVTNSSEIPDAQTIALSQLANPSPQVRSVESRSTGETAASADRPLRLGVSVTRPPRGYPVGEVVAVRVSANMQCYSALICVDAEGRSRVVFRSPGASRGFSCAVKAGPSAGEEKLLAVASVSPLGGADPASLLRGPERGPRYEWATDSASFEVRAAVRVTARPAAGGGEKPAPEKTAPRKADPDSSVPPPAEGSQVPADKGKPETAPEGKPAARPDAPKPEVSKPVAPKAAESSRVPAGEKSLLPPTRSTK